MFEEEDGRRTETRRVADFPVLPPRAYTDFPNRDSLILEASPEPAMQGEHIIACGKISGGEGNESGRRIDVGTRGREEAT